MATNADERLAGIAAVLAQTHLNAEEKNDKIARLLPSAQSKASNTSTGYVNGANELSVDERMKLITENLQETLNPEIMTDVLTKQQRPLRIYWGTATTGRPHCGYFVPMLQVASFLRAGCNVTILLADIHGFLDNLKAPIELVKYRAQYYRFAIVELLKAVGVSIDRLEFTLGSSHQLTEKYQMDLLRLCTIVTLHDARKAGSEVVKQVEDATLSGLIYPLMQSLDEEYLGVDVQFGGVDQRKIFTLAKDVLPKIGYKERAHLMNPMVPGLAGGKMSASDPNSKIDILDEPDVVKKKISKAWCVPKEVEGNGLIGFIEHVLLPTSSLKTGTARFIIERRDAEPLEYGNIDEIKQAYMEDTITPQLLKDAVSKQIAELLSSVRAAYEASPEWQRVTDLAYPPEVKKEKPKKTPKNKGTRYPGGSPAVQVQPDGSVEGNDKAQVDLASNVTAAINKLDVQKDLANDN